MYNKRYDTPIFNCCVDNGNDKHIVNCVERLNEQDEEIIKLKEQVVVIEREKTKLKEENKDLRRQILLIKIRK